MTDGARLITAVRMVSPNYFATLRIRLLVGRDFTDHDEGNAPLVAIVNETMARKFWPGQQAVGKRIEGIPIADIATMDDVVKASRAQARFNTLLLSVFGVVALLLASVGSME